MPLKRIWNRIFLPFLPLLNEEREREREISDGNVFRAEAWARRINIEITYFSFCSAVDESTARKCRRIFAVVAFRSRDAPQLFSERDGNLWRPFSRISIKRGERRLWSSARSIGRCGFIHHRVIESFNASKPSSSSFLPALRQGKETELILSIVSRCVLCRSAKHKRNFSSPLWLLLLFCLLNLSSNVEISLFPRVISFPTRAKKI